jgi:hypothetical protein
MHKCASAGDVALEHGREGVEAHTDGHTTVLGYVGVIPTPVRHDIGQAGVALVPDGHNKAGAARGDTTGGQGGNWAGAGAGAGGAQGAVADM